MAVPQARSTPQLCICDDATFLPWLTWPDVATLPDKEKIVVIVPIAGFANWGANLPLDAEEQVLARVLKAAAVALGDANANAEPKVNEVRTLMIPPLRFITAGGPDSDCAFAVDVPVALSFMDEVCASLAASGFSRVVLCNASPWNEELCDAAARDIRIARGLQMFCVNLSALGLDFNLSRGGDSDRTRIASVLADGEFVVTAGAHMAALFSEIAARLPLKNNGLLMAVSAPTPTPTQKQEGNA